LKNSTPVPSRLTDASDPFSWHAIYTRHQHEHTISQILLNKGFEVFLPVYDCVRHWKDRRKTISMPLFPCYLFVRGEMSRRQQILTTPGVHTILCTGESFAAIPAREIDAIRLAMEVQPNLEPHLFLTCGERVRVIRGSLSGVEGILLRKRGTHRLILSVEMLAQSASVEIDVSDVEPVAMQSFAINDWDGYSVRV
jgi:transcription antitermination factor NusG